MFLKEGIILKFSVGVIFVNAVFCAYLKSRFVFNVIEIAQIS